MGCEVQKLPTGQEIELHRFDTRKLAESYLHNGRGYRYDRHESWGMTHGYDFYISPPQEPGQRASLYHKRGSWCVAFWHEENK